MTERWEYCTIEFTQHQLATRWQWCWNRGSDLFTFTKALNSLGVQGWEMVNFAPEEFQHSERDADRAGRQLCEYPYKQTNATVLRAIFKRRAD